MNYYNDDKKYVNIEIINNTLTISLDSRHELRHGIEELGNKDFSDRIDEAYDEGKRPNSLQQLTQVINHSIEQDLKGSANCIIASDLLDHKTINRMWKHFHNEERNIAKEGLHTTIQYSPINYYTKAEISEQLVEHLEQMDEEGKRGTARYHRLSILLFS